MSINGTQQKDSLYIIEFAIKAEGDIARNWRLKDRSIAIAARQELIAVLAKYAFREARNESQKSTKDAQKGHRTKNLRNQHAAKMYLTVKG